VGRDYPTQYQTETSVTKRQRLAYQFLLSSSVLLLGLGEIGLVGGLIGLGGLNPGLRISGSHCDEINAKRESEENEEKEKKGLNRPQR